MLSLSVMSNSATPWTIALQAPLSMGILQAKILEWVASPPPGDLPNPGIKPRSPAVQVDSLPSEPPWKPKNTGVGSLSLLQGNSLTQESDRSLQHCRQILYLLSYQGSLFFYIYISLVCIYIYSPIYIYIYTPQCFSGKESTCQCRKQEMWALSLD